MSNIIVWLIMFFSPNGLAKLAREDWLGTGLNALS